MVYFSPAAPSLYCPAIPSFPSHTEASSSALPLNTFYWSGLLVAFCVVSIHKAWLDAFLPFQLEIPNILSDLRRKSHQLVTNQHIHNPDHDEVLSIFFCAFQVSFMLGRSRMGPLLPITRPLTAMQRTANGEQIVCMKRMRCKMWSSSLLNLYQELFVFSGMRDHSDIMVWSIKM